MIVASRAGDADSNHDDAEKRRVAQRKAQTMKVVGGVERDLVNAGLESVRGNERRVGAAIRVGCDGGYQVSLEAFDQMELDRDSLCGSAARDIKNVSRDSRH